MIEFAFVILPFLAIIFATMDFGMAVFIRATMQHAAREGVRYAVTWQTKDSETCQDDSIRAIVQKQAMGFIKDDQAGEVIKVEYYLPDTLSSTSDNSPGNIVEVSVEGYQYQWICPLWRAADPLNITVRSSDRMEGLPGGKTRPCR